METQVSYAVVGHVRREAPATSLSTTLNGSLSLDDGSYGSNRNHAQAWLSASKDSEWVVVLEDDALPVDNFQAHVRDALANLPETKKPVGAVSFYVGGGKPFPVMVEQAVLDAESAGSSWLIDDWLRWGVAVAMPADIIERTIGIYEGIKKPYDQALGAALKKQGRSILYTVPSLVDHEDGPSLLHNGGVPRKALRFGEPDQWSGAPIRMRHSLRGGRRN